MAMLLLFLMMTVSVVRPQAAVVETRRRQVEAQAAARLALDLALGKLQATLGKDRRATARGEILGGDCREHARYWTGVWNTETPSDDPVWLVSGNSLATTAPKPSPTLAARSSVEMVGAERGLVRVPLEEVDDRTSIAYWISDEAVKSSLNVRDPLSGDATGNGQADYSEFQRMHWFGLANETELKRLEQLTARRPRNELIFESLANQVTEDPGNDIWTSQTVPRSIAPATIFATLLESRELAPLVESGGERELDKHFHDLTVSAYGLLTDPARGGLKRDLSDADLSDPSAPFPLNQAFRRFVSQRADAKDRVPISGIAEDELLAMFGLMSLEELASAGLANTNLPLASTPVIVTEFDLVFGLFKNPDEGRFEIWMEFKADLWNPHATVQAANDSGVDLRVEVLGLPQFTIRLYESPWRTRTAPFRPYDALFQDGRDSALQHRIDDLRVDLFGSLRVGEVRHVNHYGYWVPSWPGVDVDDFAFMEATAAAASLVVRIYSANGELLQCIDALPYEALRFEGAEALSELPRSDDGVLQEPAYGSYQWGYHWRLHDDPAAGDLEQWSSNYDFRCPLLRPDVSRDDGGHAELFDINQDPRFAAKGSKFLLRPEFFYGGSYPFLGNFHQWYDVPLVEPISVGLLSHLQFLGKGPFAIGNPWGESLNAVFDRYYFSGLSGTRSYGDSYEGNLQALPNFRLRRFHGNEEDPDQGETAAARMVIDGAFNLNSTSVEAWRAQLAGLHLYDWEYRTHENVPIAREYVQAGLFRFRHGADRTYKHPHEAHARYPEISLDSRRDWYVWEWQPSWATAYTSGMRELRVGRNTNGIDDVSDLAEAIVARLRARGRPFDSLEDLANSGLLQRAIDDTRINTVTAWPYHDIRNGYEDRLPPSAPSFVTQADLLATLAPYATVRADTFTIRAYAETREPITGKVVARAWCEATCQRLPEPMMPDGSVPETSDFINAADGRRIHLTNIRWLDPNRL